MPTILEKIAEKHRAQHEAELAHMRTPEFTEGALSVSLCPHANAHYHGWKPAEAAPQAPLSEAA